MAGMNDEILRKMVAEMQQPGSDMNKLIEGLAKTSTQKQSSSLGQIEMYMAVMKEIAGELQAEQTVELIDEALSIFDVGVDVAMPVIEHVYTTVLEKSEAISNAHRENQFKAYEHYKTLGFSPEQAFALINKDNDTSKATITQFFNNLSKELKK